MQASASRLRLATAAALGATALLAAAGRASAQLRDTIPSQAYYAGVEELYGGEFRDAQRTFNAALRGSVKTLSAGGTVRWIDSICYHAMLGEVLFHWGQPQQALQQFDYACTLYLQYPRWMLRAQLPQQLVADTALARQAAPWGASQRGGVPGKFASSYAVAQGQLDNSQALQQGGVVMQPQLWPVDVVAIHRCLALAIRRRNEILGPLGPHDSISKNLAITLARGGAPPNHWSGAWIDVERGLALAGIGDSEQALQYLERGMLAAGQFDHPLSGVSMLEQGRLALAAGNYGAAAAMFAEAGYSAFLYGDLSTIDDSFRWGELNRLAANVSEVDPALRPAVAAARRDRLNFIAARRQLALADELMNAGDWKNAAPALAAGVALLGDSRTGVLGNQAMYLEARLEFEQGRDSAPTTLANALAGQAKISLVNFQIGLANSMFDAQTLPTRVAGPVYEELLRDPAPADAVLRPVEWMAVMLTRHEPAFHRWLLAALDRKNLSYAVEVTERAKRRRLHNALPWGGRLNAVRDLLAAPVEQLTAAQRQQQGDLLRRFAAFGEVHAAEQRLRAELDRLWHPPLTDEARGAAARLWDEYAAAIANRERQLGRVAVSRVPAEISFPPFLPALELQKKLQPGQALLVFHDTPDGLLGILLTAKASTHWNCGPSQRLSPLVAQLLRELGNVDANHVMTTDELGAAKWQQSAARVYEALFGGSSLSPAAVTELVIVPDGLAWYVPFESLIAEVDAQPVTLLSCAKIRYAPTAGLAFSFQGPWRRIQRTGVAVGELLPGEKAEQKLQSIAALEGSLDEALPLTAPLPGPAPALATLLDSLVVFENVNLQGGNGFSWSPLPLEGRSDQTSVDLWPAIASAGPQRIALPGMHTAAERGGRAPRRGGNSLASPGDELFLASCMLMSAGAETALLSRWTVGGQSTVDIVREFMQELPSTAAADAWRRSVALAAERPVDPVTEFRVKPGKEAGEVTAAHPFFWAGYLVIDSGWRPEEPQAPAAGDEPLVAGVAASQAAIPLAPGEKLPAGGPPPPTPPGTVEAARGNDQASLDSPTTAVESDAGDAAAPPPADAPPPKPQPPAGNPP